MQYNDDACTDPTGNEEVVSGDIFGYNGGCTQVSEFNNWLVECGDDGTVRTQLFAADDTTCSGEVYIESVSYGNVDITPVCSPMAIEGLYYT